MISVYRMINFEGPVNLSSLALLQQPFRSLEFLHVKIITLIILSIRFNKSVKLAAFDISLIGSGSEIQFVFFILDIFSISSCSWIVWNRVNRVLWAHISGMLFSISGIVIPEKKYWLYIIYFIFEKTKNCSENPSGKDFLLI